MCDTLLGLIKKQKEKEEKENIWTNSVFFDITFLKCNNVGIVGEEFIKKLCQNAEIDENINGKNNINKSIDGYIKNQTIEIKTARLGNNSTFQHELGEHPWVSNYMIFVDICPCSIYVTIFKNFDEEEYKQKKNFDPIFPGKRPTWRKNSGAFKLDTSLKINELNIKRKHTIKYSQLNIPNFKDFLSNIIH